MIAYPADEDDPNIGRVVRLELPDSVVEPGSVLAGQIRLIAPEQGIGREAEGALCLLWRRRTLRTPYRSEAEDDIIQSWVIRKNVRVPASGTFAMPFTVTMPEALEIDNRNYLKAMLYHPVWSNLVDYRSLQVRLPSVYHFLEQALFQAMPCRKGFYMAQLSAISAFPRLCFSYVPTGDLAKNLDRFDLHVGFTPRDVVGQIELVRSVHSVSQRLRAWLGQENRYTFPFSFSRALLETEPGVAQETGIAEVAQVFRDVITAYGGRGW